MSEKQQRTESLQPINELVVSLAQEMGEQPEQRLDWLMLQTSESFGGVLQNINATSRGIASEEHDFDGEGVQAGTVSGSIPPDQEDKISLLGELVSAAQEHITSQTEKGEDSQTILNELAVAMPTVINKLHLFSDGNGRTSRILRMVMRDGDQVTPEKIESAVHKDGYDRYDATPGFPIERSVMTHIRAINGAGEIKVIDDVVDEDTMADEQYTDIITRFPDISPTVIDAYSDTFNFYETMRLLGKDMGVESISLSELFTKIADDPEEMGKFTAVYRGVRKQRVEVLMKGLTGEVPVPFGVRGNEKAIDGWINHQRESLGVEPVDPDSIKTIQDFQMAYCDVMAPQRIAA